LSPDIGIAMRLETSSWLGADVDIYSSVIANCKCDNTDALVIGIANGMDDGYGVANMMMVYNDDYNNDEDQPQLPVFCFHCELWSKEGMVLTD